MSDSRLFRENPIYQGEDERIVYSVTTTPWGGGSASPDVTVKLAGGDDVTDDVTDGAATGSDDVVTTPVIHSLEAGKTYRLEVKWTHPDGHVLEAHAFIYARE